MVFLAVHLLPFLSPQSFVHCRCIHSFGIATFIHSFSVVAFIRSAVLQSLFNAYFQ